MESAGIVSLREHHPSLREKEDPGGLSVTETGFPFQQKVIDQEMRGEEEERVGVEACLCNHDDPPEFLVDRCPHCVHDGLWSIVENLHTRHTHTDTCVLGVENNQENKT